MLCKQGLRDLFYGFILEYSLVSHTGWVTMILHLHHLSATGFVITEILMSIPLELLYGYGKNQMIILLLIRNITLFILGNIYIGKEI